VKHLAASVHRLTFSKSKSVAPHKQQARSLDHPRIRPCCRGWHCENTHEAKASIQKPANPPSFQ
jgi:hypothetical protein